MRNCFHFMTMSCIEHLVSFLVLNILGIVNKNNPIMLRSLEIIFEFFYYEFLTVQLWIIFTTKNENSKII